MTGREKIEAALSKEGTGDIPAVICYEGILVEDHWDQFTSCPWWYRFSPDIEQQTQWRRDLMAAIGHDWYELASVRRTEEDRERLLAGGRPYFYSRDERRRLAVEERPQGVFLANALTGWEERLDRPPVHGWSTSAKKVESIHPERLAQTPDELDELIHIPLELSAERIAAEGRHDLAARWQKEFGVEKFPLYSTTTPFCSLYFLWGFEAMMTMVMDRPDLVRHACQRFLESSLASIRMAASLGVAGIWISDSFTDMLNPEQFREFHMPSARPLIEGIRSAGMKSFYYYGGDPKGKWDQILDLGVDAISFEESKKYFRIDIEDVVDIVQGRYTVLGNLDAMDLLPKASEAELRAELSRQIAAGRRNGSRFIMSLGSPVTPETPVERVRLYCDLVRELG